MDSQDQDLRFAQTDARHLRFFNLERFQNLYIVYAATYSGGRMTGISAATVKEGSAEFSKALGSDDVLFFLTVGSTPVCEDRLVSDAIG